MYASLWFSGADGGRFGLPEAGRFSSPTWESTLTILCSIVEGVTVSWFGSSLDLSPGLTSSSSTLDPAETYSSSAHVCDSSPLCAAVVEAISVVRWSFVGALVVSVVVVSGLLVVLVVVVRGSFAGVLVLSVVGIE